MAPLQFSVRNDVRPRKASRSGPQSFAIDSFKLLRRALSPQSDPRPLREPLRTVAYTIHRLPEYAQPASMRSGFASVAGRRCEPRASLPRVLREGWAGVLPCGPAPALGFLEMGRRGHVADEPSAEPGYTTLHPACACLSICGRNDPPSPIARFTGGSRGVYYGLGFVSSVKIGYNP